jgi:hypothetical protein
MLPGTLFPRFQRDLFFEKGLETVSDLLVGTYGKEYTFCQLCCSYPRVAFGGCGNSMHSGCCCSEIAFRGQGTEQLAFRRGNQRPTPSVALYTGMNNIYTIFGLATNK